MKSPAFAQIVDLLDALSRDEQLQLISIIVDNLRGLPLEPDEDGEGESRRYLPRLPRMMEWGLVRPHDRLYIRGFEDKPALLLNQHEVVYEAQVLRINDWAKLVTGWSSVNIYEWVVLERDGRTLHEIRMAFLKEHGLE